MNNISLVKSDNSAVQFVDTTIRRKLHLYAKEIICLEKKWV
jgi:hypothetical protein